MDEVLKVRIEGTVKGLQEALDEALTLTEDLADELDNVGKEVKKTTKGFDIFKKSSPIMRKLNQETRGLASQFADVGKSLLTAASAAGVFSAALIATGIGALVVAAGLLVLYWDEIVQFATGFDLALKGQQEELKKMGDEAQEGLDLYKGQANVLKLQGKTQKEINSEVQNRIVGVINIRKSELLLAKTQLENLQTYAENLKKFSQKVIFFMLQGPLAFAKAMDEVMGTDLQKRIYELADSTTEWITSFVGVEDATEDVKDLTKEIGKLENEAAGLKLKNIEIDKKAADKEAKEAAKELARVLKITASVNKIVLDSELEDEIFDPTEIAKIDALNTLINAPKSWEVKGIEEANYLIKEQEKSINSLLQSFDWLTEGQREYVKSLQTDEIEAYREKLMNLEETSQMLASAVGGVLNDAFRYLYDTFKTGVGVLDTLLGLMLSLIEQTVSKLLQALVIEKVLGTARNKINEGVATGSAISAATATAALIPFGAFALPGLIAASVAATKGAFAGLASFAGGGFSGDRNIVRMNGNELILNPMQQSTLFNLLRGTMPSSNGGGISANSQANNMAKMEWKIRGADLVLATSRSNRRTNRGLS